LVKFVDDARKDSWVSCDDVVDIRTAVSLVHDSDAGDNAECKAKD